MVEIRTCACGCGEETPRSAKTGRPRIYASGACRVRALRRRRALAEIEALPDYVLESPVSYRAVPTDEQVAQAILQTRAVGFALQRLGVEARPELAWRCTTLGDAIIESLRSTFPETER